MAMLDSKLAVGIGEDLAECIRVVIADDHPLFRAGLHYTLSLETDVVVVGEVGSGTELRNLDLNREPDVLLLDLRMPGPPALETLADVQERWPKTRVLMLTAFDDEAHVRALVEAGVSGYLLKEEAPSAVSQAVHAVASGHVWFSQCIAEKLLRPTDFSNLTPREREVLALVAQGRNNLQIAAELQVAEITVRFHLRNIREKIGVHSRSEALRWAILRGLGE